MVVEPDCVLPYLGGVRPLWLRVAHPRRAVFARCGEPCRGGEILMRRLLCGYAGVNRRAGPLPIKVEFVIGGK